MISTQNITTVRDVDREFIQYVLKLTADKKALVKGIIIGLQLGDEKNDNVYKKPQASV